MRFSSHQNQWASGRVCFDWGDAPDVYDFYGRAE